MRHKEHPAPLPSGNEGTPWRFQRWAIADPEEIPLAARRDFSAMKYGDPTATDAIAAEIAALLLADAQLQALVTEKGKLWLAPSAYGAVESAAACLAAAVVSALRAAGWVVETFKIDREGGFERTNYGALGHSAREKALRHRKISLAAGVAEQLRDQVVVVLDDLRCTGAHERAIQQLLAQETAVRQLAFAYCITFQGEMKAEQEEKLNHAKVKSLEDLVPMLQAGERAPRWNARLVKYILRHPASVLEEFWPRIGHGCATILYWAAIQQDGYCDMPRFRTGFVSLEEWLHPSGKGYRLSHKMRCEREGKVVAHHIRENGTGRFVDAVAGHAIDELMAMYSRFKFGDITAMQAFVAELATAMIGELQGGGKLRAVFERARKQGEFVSLTAPGVRNVISASNHLAREVGLRVNAWLSLNALPTMLIRTLPRLSSGRANYAELSAKERAARDKTTQTIIPRSEYQEFPSHVIFIDDVEVSGQTSQRARQKSLKAKALTFHSAFLFKVDPNQALADAGIEHRMNQCHITGHLDAALAEVLRHPDYQPVQRMLRLLLHPNNTSGLPAFLKAHVADTILQRIYLGALSNDYLWINAPAAGEKGIYAPSLALMGHEMESRGLMGQDGQVLF